MQNFIEIRAKRKQWRKKSAIGRENFCLYSSGEKHSAQIQIEKKSA